MEKVTFGMLPIEIRESLINVVHYCWDKELYDFRFHREPGEKHIFESLVVLNNLVDNVEFSPEYYLGEEEK